MRRLTQYPEVEQFIKAHPLTFLYISQPSCSVCVGLLPKVEKLLSQFPAIQGAYVDAAQIPSVAGELSIFTVPAVLLFVEGKEVLRYARFISLDELEFNLAKYVHLVLEE